MSEFEKAFAPLLEILSDPGGQFHGQTMVDDLLAIEPLINDAADAARFYRELAVLQGKRGYEEAVDYTDKAVAADRVAKVLEPKQLFWMHVLSARVAGDELFDSGRAIIDLHAALAQADVIDLPADDRLSLQQDVGMHLHEENKFEEALAVNMEVLADAERLYGEGAWDTHVVLNNIAENYYKLGDFESARRFLVRRRVLLEAAGDDGRISDTIFKLGVLSFEEGDFKTAKTIFKERLALAKATGDEVLIDLAKETLSEYYDRLGRPRDVPRQE